MAYIKETEQDEKALINEVWEGGKQHAATEGEVGYKGNAWGNEILLKKGKLEMSIREDFLAVRIAGLEIGLPWEEWEAPSLRISETRQSQTVIATWRKKVWTDRGWTG